MRPVFQKTSILQHLEPKSAHQTFRKMVIIMMKFLTSALVALALLGTVSVVSAAPKHYSVNPTYQSLDDELNFWKQFGD